MSIIQVVAKYATFVYYNKMINVSVHWEIIHCVYEGWLMPKFINTLDHTPNILNPTM